MAAVGTEITFTRLGVPFIKIDYKCSSVNADSIIIRLYIFHLWKLSFHGDTSKRSYHSTSMASSEHIPLSEDIQGILSESWHLPFSYFHLKVSCKLLSWTDKWILKYGNFLCIHIKMQNRYYKCSLCLEIASTVNLCRNRELAFVLTLTAQEVCKVAWHDLQH